MKFVLAGGNLILKAYKLTIMSKNKTPSWAVVRPGRRQNWLMRQ
jgi:hypothetical protein